MVVSVDIISRLTQDQPRINPCVHICAYVVNIHSYLCVSDLYQCIYAYICTYPCISVHIQLLVSISVHMCVSVYIVNICQYLSISVHMYISVHMFVSVCNSLYLSICLYLFICSYLCTSLRSSSQGSNSQQQSATVQQSRQSGHGCLFIYFSNMFISVYIGVYQDICNINRYEQDMCMYKSAHICGGDINKSS